MTSAIDATKPGEGEAFTADVRQNFQIAADEISALQTTVASLQATIQDQYDALTTLQAQSVYAVSVTASGINTESTDFVAVGVGCQFTPPKSTRAVFSAEGALGNTDDASESDIQLVYGVGPAPAPATLLTDTNGVLIGLGHSILTLRVNDYGSFFISALVSSIRLTVGQQYWIDVAVRAVTGTATLSPLMITAQELLDPVPGGAR